MSQCSFDGSHTRLELVELRLHPDQRVDDLEQAFDVCPTLRGGHGAGCYFARSRLRLGPGPMLYATEAISGRRLDPRDHPVAPLIASVDLPRSTTTYGPERTVRIAGWVVSPYARDARVIVTIGSIEQHEIPVDVERAELAHALAHVVPESEMESLQRALARPNGFDATLEIPDDDLVLVTIRFTDGEVVITSDEYRFERVRPPVPEYRLPSAAPRRAPLEMADASRAEYQEVWDSVAGDRDVAKIAVAGYVDESRFELTADETFRTLQRTVGIKPDDVVLEIGAGVGRVGVALAPRCRRWIATDVSARMLEHARARLKDFDNVETVVTNGWDLAPIPDSSVDVVYCTVVFMHLEEWERFAYVCEARRILRPGGRLYIDNFTLTGDDGWAFFRHHFENFHPLDRPPNISKSSTPAELRTYLTRAGFDDVRVAESSFFTWAWGRKPDGT